MSYLVEFELNIITVYSVDRMSSLECRSHQQVSPDTWDVFPAHSISESSSGDTILHCAHHYVYFCCFMEHWRELHIHISDNDLMQFCGVIAF